VGFDATACLGVRTGVGRFASEVLGRIADDPGLEVHAFVVSWRGRDALAAVAPPGARVVRRPMAARPLRLAWARLDRPRIETWTGPLDVVHGPNYVVPPSRRAARIVTVHDLTPLRFPELANLDTRAYPALVAAAVARGAWVQTPTEFVRDEVIEHFAVDPGRVVAVPYGVTPPGPEVPGTAAGVGRRRAGVDRYVLALGTVEPRKDLTALVAAFDRVAGGDRDVGLVIAGQDGWGADEVTAAIADARHTTRIVRLGHVDESARVALLRGAAVLAYPSRYEGFGLPPLEAMDIGVPVVCTNAGSLPEVLGDAADYVDAALLEADRDAGVDALAEALRRVLTDEARRAELVELGRARAARYSWDRTAGAIAELYRRVSAPG
jgi:glycosyltransferase involved in cell wall biosynthesis